MARETGLQFVFSAAAIKEDWAVIDFDWQESVFKPFLGQINLASSNKKINPDDLIDSSAQLKIYQDGQLKRSFSGIISVFNQGNIGTSRRFYKVQLVPSYSRLTLRHNSRIFQQQSVIDIIQILLAEMQIENYALSLKEDYFKREYCVQYNETDFDFIQRLLAEVGIYYYFEQTENGHTLVFADHFHPPKLAEPTPYISRSSGVIGEPFVKSFSIDKAIKVTDVKMADYSFKHPKTNLLTQAQTSKLQGPSQIEYRHFYYSGRYQKTKIGQKLTGIRLGALRNKAHTAKGGIFQGSCRLKVKNHAA